MQGIAESKIVLEQGRFPGFEELEMCSEVHWRIIGAVEIDAAEEAHWRVSLDIATSDWYQATQIGQKQQEGFVGEPEQYWGQSH